MSASDGDSSAIGARSLRLQYDLTTAEAFWALSQIRRTSWLPWLRPAIGAVAAALAVDAGIRGRWSTTVFFGMVAISTWTRLNKAMLFLAIVCRGEVHCDLVVDRAGIRGTLCSQLTLLRRSYARQVDHSWSQ